jgi:hypothetical protein
MTLLQDLGLFEEIAGDLGAFAAGQPVTATRTIGDSTVSVSVAHLGTSPTAGYQTLTGGVVGILLLALADATAVAAGQPLKIAERVGNTWYGETVTFSPAKVAATP